MRVNDVRGSATLTRGEVKAAEMARLALNLPSATVGGKSIETSSWLVIHKHAHVFFFLVNTQPQNKNKCVRAPPRKKKSFAIVTLLNLLF